MVSKYINPHFPEIYSNYLLSFEELPFNPFFPFLLFKLKNFQHKILRKTVQNPESLSRKEAFRHKTEGGVGWGGQVERSRSMRMRKWIAREQIRDYEELSVGCLLKILLCWGKKRKLFSWKSKQGRAWLERDYVIHLDVVTMASLSRDREIEIIKKGQKP